MGLRQIKASAGSGKTYTLTSDILTLLAGASERILSGCVTPGGEAYGWPEILGVTFTNRAAQEMKDRVLDRLKAMALGITAPEEGWSAGSASLAVDNVLRNTGSLNIRTIDSLIHLIVRLAALDLNLPPDFEPEFEDGRLFAPLLDTMAERAREGDATLLRAFSRACAQVVRLGEFKGFLAGSEVRERICALAAFLLREPDIADLPLASPEEIKAGLEDLRRDMGEKSRRLRELLQGKDVHLNLLKALDKCADESLPHKELFKPSTMFARDCLQDCCKAKARAVPGAEAEALFLQVREAVRCFAAQAPVLRDALRFMPFVDLARQLTVELVRFQRTSGFVPASRVPALAERVLTGEYGVNETFCRMGNRLTHILVDEFQDTSREQWQAMKSLAVEALSHGGSLTVVGDVKQAIYGWRGGDADLFDEVPDDPELSAMVPHVEREQLAYNWRSRERIISWNNAVFSSLTDLDLAEDIMRCFMGKNPIDSEMAEAVDKLSRAFAHSAQHVERAKPGGVVRLTRLALSSSPNGENSGEEALARLLPQRVLALHTRYAWRDMTILTRSHQETSLALGWLLRHGVPVVTQGSLLLAEQPLIIQTVALLEFLDAPDDDFAFWVLLSGGDLLPTLPGLDRDRMERWAAGRFGAGREKFQGLSVAFRRDFPVLWAEFFAPLLDEAGLLTPYDTVQEIFQHWQVRERHPQARGFLLRFLEILYLAEQRGCTDLSSFIQYWREKGQEEKAPLPESMDAVRIMTIHKAKGLESEVILVPWHQYTVKASDGWQLWHSAGLDLVVPLSSAMGEVYDRDLGRAGREALHLLYVAWTRAVSELHCFFTEPGRNVMSKALNLLLEPVLGHPDLRELAPGDWQWGSIPDEGPDKLGKLHTLDKQTEFVEPDNDHGGGRGNFPPAGSGAEPQVTPHWRPMHWLPRLQIFRSQWEDWTHLSQDGRRRGTLLHHCLEYLHKSDHSDNPRQHAVAAVRRGLAGMRLPDRELLEQEFVDALAWYVALPDSAHWLRYGIPEHGLLGEKGESLRVDLLVDDGKALLAVEYKSGGRGDLPKLEHVRQLERYVKLLSKAEQRQACGVLVYLDRRVLFRLGEL